MGGVFVSPAENKNCLQGIVANDRMDKSCTCRTPGVQ